MDDGLLKGLLKFIEFCQGLVVVLKEHLDEAVEEIG